MSANIPISKSEIEACKEAVQNFRVHELHLLVSNFKYPKIGKKQELVSRATSILSNPKYQLQAVQKVREIQANNRVRETSQPYSLPTTTTGGTVTNNIQTNGVATNTMTSQHNPYMNMNSPNMSAAVNYAAAANYNFMQQVYQQGFNPYGHFPGAQGMHGFSHSMPQLNQHHQQQQQQHVVPMQHSTGLAKNLRTVELPFYDLIKVIFPMTELPSYPVATRPGEGRYQCTFGVQAEDIPKLTYPESQPLPRYELQMRMFLLEVSEEQQDAFPPGSVVRLDDYNVNLPPVIPTNKPNAEQKRYPRPVNLTPYCRPPRGRERPHRLHFEWNGDKRSWAFTINYVRRLNSDILLDRIRKNPNAIRPFNKTKEAIIRRLNGTDEDDVQMDSLKISLIDPLGRTRIKIPSRASDCTHLQSFDLYNYLMMNEKRPGWKCPVCDKNAIYSRLIIDEYFEKMLKSVGSSVEDVELLRDGTWQLPHVNNMVSLDSDEEEATPANDDDDEDIMIVEKPAKGEKKKSEPAQQQQVTTPKVEGTQKEQQQQHPKQPQQPAKASSSKHNDSDIICLSSDDEDESEQLASAIAASHVNTASAAGTPNSNVSGAGNSATASKEKGATTTTAGANQYHHQQQQNQQTPQQQGRLQKNGHSGSATPVLQINGQQPPIFRPIMDELAKTQIAQNLALFLQNVYAKNSQQLSATPPTPNSTPNTNNNNT